MMIASRLLPHPLIIASRIFPEATIYFSPIELIQSEPLEQRSDQLHLISDRIQISVFGAL
jgi:hypothetical protein